jgi:sugar/nucleoside kinase (ribokinase family)
LVADLIVAIPTLPAEAGQHQNADEIRLEPGGGANFLIAGARLGYPMAAIGVLGDDHWGRLVAALIEAEGVDLAGVQRVGTTTMVIVLVSQSGEHVFLGKHGQTGKIVLTELEITMIKGAGAIYLAGYTLLEAGLVELALEATRLAKQTGIPIFFDPGPQIAQVSPALRQTFLSLVDTVFAAEAEIPLLVSGSVTDLINLGPSTVVVKRGPAGCVIYERDQQSPLLEAPGYPVPVVDTSAAGDSFNAGFMAARLWGWSLADAARLANAVGAAKVKKLGGGRNVPTLAEVRAIINQFGIEFKQLI